MITLFIIIWLLLGMITVWRTYHGFLKHWYICYNESYWKYVKEQNGTVFKILFLGSPIFIIGGLLTLLLFEFSFQYNCWWFTTKNK